MSSPSPARVPPPRLDALRARLAVRLGQVGAVAARFLRTSGRRLHHLWRSSLQFRVIVSTMLLGLIVCVLLGSWLYQRIGSGLVDQRMVSATASAAQGTRAMQARFDSSTATQPADRIQLARDLVQQLASPGVDQSREVILTRSTANLRQAVVPTILSGQISLSSVPTDLRAAVAKSPGRQQVKITSVTDPSTGASVPAIIVGQQVSLPPAVPYELYFIFPMEQEQKTLGNVARAFALGAIALVLLVGAVAYVVTRLVVDPVRRAALVAERLAAGRLNERMRVKGEDDLARLAASFNAMADSLQRQIRQLEDLSRVQQRFVSDVSHELRTPLTTIRMAGELLHDSRADFDPAASRSAELLHHEIDRFESLLTDLLEISRFDAGAAALDLDATDVAAIVTRVVQDTQSIAERRGSVVTVRQTPRPCIAEIDPRRVERILRNLVVNGIEHGEGRPITVTVDANTTAVAVSIRDQGVGLRPGEAALVFNRFWRADPARARTTGGTGLGLAISLEDARLHNGWLQAWGEPGAGSCFRLTLPRRAGVPIERSPVPLAPAQLAAQEPSEHAVSETAYPFVHVPPEGGP